MLRARMIYVDNFSWGGKKNIIARSFSIYTFQRPRIIYLLDYTTQNSTLILDLQ